MHKIEEAIAIYEEEKAKNPDFDSILVMEWRENMPDKFACVMFERKYGCHIVDVDMYTKAVSLFEWVDDRGTGAKWSVEDIEKVSGIDFDDKEYTLLDFAYVMNMLYADNCNVFTDTSYYIKMSKNYLEDNDYMGDPSERAYKNAKKRIKYFSEG